jgi:hypothetical protein
VVREPRLLGVAAARAQRLQRRPVQREPAVRRDRLVDRQSRQLVPELDVRRPGDQHPRGFVDAIGELAGERFEQPQLDGPGDDCHRVEQPARRLGQPRRPADHGVAHRVGDPLATGRQRLDDEERVAAGAAVELCGVGAVRRGELGHGVRRERRELEPPRPAHELAEQDAQLLGAVEFVVAVGGERERGDGGDPRDEQADDVERRLVSPVQVLEDEHGRRAAAQLVEQRGGDVVRARRPGHELGERPTGGLGDVEERAEWRRRAQRLARAPQDAGVGGFAEAAQECGLADARFAADEQQTTLGPDPGEQAGERGQAVVALEQRHGSVSHAQRVRPSRSAFAPASPRLETSSLRSTAETWWLTVFSDTTRRSAICALRSPSASSASTSTSRAVRPAGFSRVRA